MIANHWECPKLWPNETIFIIGGGPSVNDMPLHLIYKRRVIGVNSAFRLGNWIDVCFFGDGRWFNLEYGALRGFKGLIVGIYPFKDNGELGQTEGVAVKLIDRDNRKGVQISTNPKVLSWNRSSGAAAVNLAVHLGAKRIVLVGFDMRMVNKSHNFHDIYPWPRGKPNVGPHHVHVRSFKGIKAQLDKLNVRIVNATPGSRIKAIPFVALEEAVNKWPV